MPPDPDETVRRALELAEGALDALIETLDAATSVDDLRRVWVHWLEVGVIDRPARRVAGELVLGTFESVVERDLFDLPPPGDPPWAAAPAAQHTPRPLGPPPLVAPDDRDRTLVGQALALQAEAVLAREDLRAAQDALDRAQPRFARAQVRFGNAIRRLQEGGRSPATIAAALGVSVETVARATGQWSEEDAERPYFRCSFCRRSGSPLPGTPAAARPLVAGPGVWICAECVESAMLTGTSGTGAPPDGSPMNLVGADQDHPTCNFCAKRADQADYLVAAAGVGICDECIDLCFEIIAEEFGHG